MCALYKKVGYFLNRPRMSDPPTRNQSNEFSNVIGTRARVVKPPTRFQDYVMNKYACASILNVYGKILKTIKRKKDVTIGIEPSAFIDYCTVVR